MGDEQALPGINRGRFQVESGREGDHTTDHRRVGKAKAKRIARAVREARQYYRTAIHIRRPKRNGQSLLHAPRVGAEKLIAVFGELDKIH